MKVLLLLSLIITIGITPAFAEVNSSTDYNPEDFKKDKWKPRECQTIHPDQNDYCESMGANPELKNMGFSEISKLKEGLASRILLKGLDGDSWVCVLPSETICYINLSKRTYEADLTYRDGGFVRTANPSEINNGSYFQIKWKCNSGQCVEELVHHVSYIQKTETDAVKILFFSNDGTSSNAEKQAQMKEKYDKFMEKELQKSISNSIKNSISESSSENYEVETLKPLPSQYNLQQQPPSEDNFQVKQSEQPSINKFQDMTPPEK
tara:strand:- start:298 stop:1092 length:795 start_codon:yes stop_codon:yes gene_type:complete